MPAGPPIGDIRKRDESLTLPDRRPVFAKGINSIVEVFRRAILLSLSSEVAQAYYELLGFDLQLAIARRNRDAFHRSFDIFDQRFRSGIVSRLETARAEAALATVAAAIPELERQIVIKENQINVLLGQNPAPLPRIARLLDDAPLPEVPAGLPSALLERRPDIRQAEAFVRAANAQVGVATANFFPQIGLTALFGRQSAPLQGITSGSAGLWNAIAAASGPIFQAGNLKAQKRQAIAAWQETQLAYQSTALGAFREVADTLVSREKFEQVRVEQERAVRAYEVSVDVATQRYIAGRASYLEVLTAQQELFPAERSLAQTQINQRLVVIQLYRALGGGWSIQDPNWAKP
jgi:multidrug efflux system outer membrane protein